MNALVPSLILGFLGVATGIFFVLSMVEKPVWKLMRQPRAADVSDEMARTIHAQLKRVIHLLPPTMITTLSGTTVLLVIQLFQTGFALMAWVVAAVFLGQFILIIMRLKKDIDNVDKVPSDSEIGVVRDGLGALAFLHHRGLLGAVTTFIAQIVLIVQ